MINGMQLRLLRSLKSVGQAALAKMLGKSQQYISKLEKLESEDVPIYWAGKILRVLNCNETELQKIKEMLPPPRTHFEGIVF